MFATRHTHVHKRAMYAKQHYPGLQYYLLLASIFILFFQICARVSIFYASFRLSFLPSTTSPSQIRSLFQALHHKLSPHHHAHRANSFQVEIFSAPKPFIDADKHVNLRAIRSWKRLKPTPKITLLGNDTGYQQVVEQYGLGWIPYVDTTFLGVPLFNSMFHVANQSSATVAVIINGDIMLLQDFMQAVKRVLARFSHFLVVAARYDLDRLPEQIGGEGSESFGANLKQFVLQHGVLHTYGGMDLWAWNTNGPRLYDGEMPHFIFGRGKYDNWLTHQTIVAGRRHVVDASEAILSVHVRHGYNLVSRRTADAAERAQELFWSKGKKSKFELFINIYLSLHHGSYSNQMGSILFAPWRLGRCLEVEASCFVRRVRPGVCTCEYSSSCEATQTDAVVVEKSRVIRCGRVSKEVAEEYRIPIEAGKQDGDGGFGLPHTLKGVAERVVVNNTLVVTALNYGYREIMMNWVCNLRQLRVSNFVIAAFDVELYEFGYVRSLPIYLETSVLKGRNMSHLDASYGSDSFKELTKMKSRVVVRFLKLGYNVVWSDSDIIWFKNPIGRLWEHDADIIMQTNAPDGEDANEIRRINSGFYLAKSTEGVVKTFEAVIRYAGRSKMSEQPCFYDVICGKSGERRTGTSGCRYEGTRLELLDRELFPNGITGGIWNVRAGRIVELFPNIVVLHNNWVEGVGRKKQRVQRHGLVFYDAGLGLCLYRHQ